MIPGLPPLSFSGGDARSGDAGNGAATDQGAGAWNVNLGGSGYGSGSGSPGNALGGIPPILLYAGIALAVWYLWKKR